MAVALGRFLPSSGYEAVRPLFRSLSEACAAAGGVVGELYRQRDGLGLHVVDHEGRELPVEWVMIYDYEFADPEIEVKLVDRADVERVRNAHEPG